MLAHLESLAVSINVGIWKDRHFFQIQKRWLIEKRKSARWMFVKKSFGPLHSDQQEIPWRLLRWLVPFVNHMTTSYPSGCSTCHRKQSTTAVTYSIGTHQYRSATKLQVKRRRPRERRLECTNRSENHIFSHWPRCDALTVIVDLKATAFWGTAR